MAKSQETFNKKEKEKKRLKKRKEKQQKKEERRANSEGGGFESMLAYVDENGNLTDTPPNPSNKQKIDAKSIEIGVPKKVREETDVIRKGRVEFFDASKRFGFIKEIETQEKFFVHANSLNEVIQEGDKVTFESEKGLKGMNAVRVNKI